MKQPQFITGRSHLTVYNFVAVLLLLLSVAASGVQVALALEGVGADDFDQGLTDTGSTSVNSNEDVSYPPGALKWAILLDLTRSDMTTAGFSAAVAHYIATAADRTESALFARPPVVLDSRGDLITALTAITHLIADEDTFPDVLFLAETTDVSMSVVDILRQDSRTSKILLVSAHASNSNLCDPKTNPRTMCMVPRDMINVRGLLDVVSSQLSWYSMAMVFSNSGYGQGVQSTVPSQVQDAQTTPTIVASLFMNVMASEADDDALVLEIQKHKPKGIACFLRADQMLRLRSALQRAGVDDTMFIIGSRESLNLRSTLTGALEPVKVPAWGALFVSMYTSIDKLLAQGYFSNSDEIDDYGAYVLSHVFDGMRMIAEADGTQSMQRLRAVHFTGFTGTVAFDPIYFQRVESTFSLITASFPVSDALVTWYVASYSVPAVTVNRYPAVTHALIPESPLRSVTVCMASPSSCADAVMMSSMLSVLLLHNHATSEMENQSSFLPVAINTGESGVVGLSALIPVARTCTVLTGPGLARVAIAVTPVVNEFHISQLDYNTANDFFTTEVYTYPYFSRTIPSNSFSFTAYAEVCKHFAWERVILVSSEDQLGTSRTNSMSSAMEKHNIYVERIYSIVSVTKDSVVDTLQTIYKEDVSRIILWLLPQSSTNAAMFFDLAEELPFMKDYIFLLSKDLCNYAAANPAQRQKLNSSICFFPDVPADRLTAVNDQIAASPAVLQEVRTVLSDGKFIVQAESCRLGVVKPYSGFAVDAAYVLIDAVTRALGRNVTLNNSASLRDFIRNTTIDKFTGPFTIESNGNRNFATFVADIQTPNDGVVKVGVWDERKKPAFSRSYTTPFMWMTGSTEVPLDTFRDYSFVLGATVSASPGAIVLSVLGFVCTIAIFFFCYRHYRMQKLIELTLLSDTVPVTEEELRRLRGITEDL